MALQLVQARLAGTDGLAGNRMSADHVQQLWSRNDNLAARLVMDDLMACVCGGAMPAELAPACAALRDWDCSATLDARGAPLFREFWRKASVLGAGIWAVPFDKTDPVHTPRGLKQDPTTTATLSAKLLEAAQLLASPQGEVAVPGGEEFEGVLNKTSAELKGGRYAPFHGTSYVQLITLGAGSAGQSPTARGFLSYSESTDPRSPFFSNQSAFFSSLSLQPLPELH